MVDRLIYFLDISDTFSFIDNFIGIIVKPLWFWLCLFSFCLWSNNLPSFLQPLLEPPIQDPDIPSPKIPEHPRRPRDSEHPLIIITYNLLTLLNSQYLHIINESEQTWQAMWQRTTLVSNDIMIEEHRILRDPPSEMLFSRVFSLVRQVESGVHYLDVGGVWRGEEVL